MIRLTSAFADSVEAPQAGEAWHADELQPGFGIRVWRNKSGSVGKSYAVRAKGLDGKFVRRTLPAKDLVATSTIRELVHIRGKVPTFGDFLADARRWAADQIAALNGRPTEGELEGERRARRRNQARALTFEEAAERIWSDLRLKGCSAEYIARLQKLYDSSVPSNVRLAKIHKIEPNDVERLFSRLTPGNVRLFRPFVRKILSRVEFLPESAVSPDTLSSVVPDHNLSARLTRDFQSFDEAWFLRVAEVLEAEEQHWQQALCLRLYFGLDAHLSRVMSGRWADVTVSPGRGGHIWLWRSGEKGWRRYQRFVGESEKACLERARRKGAELFGNSPYWFPSTHDRGAGHIRSVDYLWRRTLASMGCFYVTPRTFRIAFDEATELRRSREVLARVEDNGIFQSKNSKNNVLS